MIKWRHISEINEENTLPITIYSSDHRLHRLQIEYITEYEVTISYNLESSIRSSKLFSKSFDVSKMLASEIIEDVRKELDYLHCTPTDRLNFIQLIDNEVNKRLENINEVNNNILSYEMKNEENIVNDTLIDFEESSVDSKNADIIDYPTEEYYDELVTTLDDEDDIIDMTF